MPHDAPGLVVVTIAVSALAVPPDGEQLPLGPRPRDEPAAVHDERGRRRDRLGRLLEDHVARAVLAA
jgi:hypothetical protein